MNTLSSWPNLGAKNFFTTDNEKLYEIKDYSEHNTASRSDYILDDMTNPHPRFPTMMNFVRSRRGKKVDIRVPLYPDINTGEGKIDGHITPGEIHMDAQHFGMGCSCLQITFETQNIEHAKYLHDCFIPLTPIIGALSASAPIYKGQLSNWDFRWNIIRDSVDSRTDEEKDPSNPNHMPKSRYSGMNHFISDHPYFAGDNLNDGTKLKVNEEWYDKLKEAGMTDRLAYHFASLFVHDSLVIFKDRTDYDPDCTEHFENLNSTNWNSVRFKPPPSLDSSIGWRVEFRTPDIQITDYENAAYIALVNLLTRILNDFDIDVSLPISL
jgi:glutamate--cysteine ligase catalytic subunit